MKRILTLLAFVALTITANAVIQSGSCGDNVTFVLNDDGTLVISGSGDMKNYDWPSSVPWYDNSSKIIKAQIEDGVTSIGREAFYYCYGLTSITIPNSVTSIGNDAFCLCANLTSVIIPNSVTSIGDVAFAYCSGLTSVTIPNSVTSIGVAAFRNCSNLTSITIPNSVTSIGNDAFYQCSGLTSITIPNSVKSIVDMAFRECSGLTSITIGNSVTSIGGYAFYQCSGLTSITIGNSVTSIGNYAFSGCSKLKEIHSQAITPPTAYTSTFGGVSKNDRKLYVPTGTKEAYASAEGWKEFINIIEDGTTAITLSDISNKYGDVEFYTLNGVKIDAPSKSGVYVVKKNGAAKKVVIKK